MNIEILISRLIEYYNVQTITQLAQKLDTTQSTISGWRARNAIGALTDKVASVDPQALSSIFTSSSSNQIIQNNNGNNALNNFGEQSNSDKIKEFDEDVKDILKKAAACINQNNKESFIKHIKSWIVDNL